MTLASRLAPEICSRTTLALSLLLLTSATSEALLRDFHQNVPVELGEIPILHPGVTAKWERRLRERATHVSQEAHWNDQDSALPVSDTSGLQARRAAASSSRKKSPPPKNKKNKSPPPIKRPPPLGKGEVSLPSPPKLLTPPPVKSSGSKLTPPPAKPSGSNGLSDMASAYGYNVYRLIMELRAQQSLKIVPWSRAMAIVANYHANDTVYYQPNRTAGCSLHSWSAYTLHPCCYYMDNRDPYCMWLKPQQLTTSLPVPFPGYGYEISVTFPAGSTADVPVSAWHSSASHNAIMMSESPWDIGEWRSMACGYAENGYLASAHCWFAFEADTNKQYAQPL